jgi:hypothetical protein
MVFSFFKSSTPAAETFDPVKARPLLKMSVTRLRIVKDKRRNDVARQRRELAELIVADNYAGARARVEGVMRDQASLEAFDVLQNFAELLASRLPQLAQSPTCPIELKEPLTSLIWASRFLGVGGIASVAAAEAATGSSGAIPSSTMVARAAASSSSSSGGKKTVLSAEVPEFEGLIRMFGSKYGAPFLERAFANTDLSVHEQLRVAFAPDVPSERRCILFLESVSKQFGVPFDAEKLQGPSAVGAGGGAAGAADDDVDPELMTGVTAPAGDGGETDAGFYCQGVFIPYVAVPRDAWEAKILALRRCT